MRQNGPQQVHFGGEDLWAKPLKFFATSATLRAPYSPKGTTVNAKRSKAARQLSDQVCPAGVLFLLAGA